MLSLAGYAGGTLLACAGLAGTAAIVLPLAVNLFRLRWGW
jgi:hypothetical protein